MCVFSACDAFRFSMPFLTNGLIQESLCFDMFGPHCDTSCFLREASLFFCSHFARQLHQLEYLKFMVRGKHCAVENIVIVQVRFSKSGLQMSLHQGACWIQRRLAFVALQFGLDLHLSCSDLFRHRRSQEHLTWPSFTLLAFTGRNLGKPQGNLTPRRFKPLRHDNENTTSSNIPTSSNHVLFKN